MSKISFPVIAHNSEQHSGFGSALPPEELHITPSLGTTGIEYCPFGTFFIK